MAGRGQKAAGRPRADLLVAAIEACCGLVAAGYLVAVGVQALRNQPGRSLVDQLAPFVLAAIALVVLLGMALRTYRRSGSPGSRGDRGQPSPSPRVATTDAPPGPATVPVAPPTLTAGGGSELVRVISVLAEAGLLAPQVPDPLDLEAAVADAGEPVTVDTVLMAVQEAEYWRPGFRPDHYLAALAFHDSQVEQDPSTLQAQVDDLARLTGDTFPIRLDTIDVSEADGTERTQLDLTLNGVHHHLDYASHPKRLSTVLHVTVARALRSSPDPPAAPPRLAWLWTDQGVWLAALAPTTSLAQLNALLGPTGPPWTWVDDAPPLAAGHPLP